MALPAIPRRGSHWECMSAQTLFKQIAIDRLPRSGPLSGGDDHLAIRRCQTSCGIQARDTGLHAMIHHHLTFFIQGSTGLGGKPIVYDIAASRKYGIGLELFTGLQRERPDESAFMMDGTDARRRYAHAILVEPRGMGRIHAAGRPFVHTFTFDENVNMPKAYSAASLFHPIMTIR